MSIAKTDQAFKGYAMSYKVEIIGKKDPVVQLEASKLSDCNWTRTQNHLVLKRTLNHLAKLASLAKWLSFRLRTKWF